MKFLKNPFFFSGFSKKQLISLTSLLIILYSIPIAIYLVQKQVRYRSGAAPGDIYYVATNGDDSNPGTVNQPWRTIQKATDTVAAGETIMVREGTYNESVNISRSGQSGNPITLTNYDNDRVTINGDGDPALRTAERPVSWWIIEGLIFDSSNSYTIQFWWGYGHHRWILKNNLIYGSAWVYGSYHTFENNEFDGSYQH